MNRETVRNTALLAMLALRPEEESAMSKELTAIADFAGELGDPRRQEPPKPMTAGESGNLRQDEPGESLAADQVLMNAKTVNGGCITVPKTFE